MNKWFDPLKTKKPRKCRGCKLYRTSESRGDCPVCEDRAFKEEIKAIRELKKYKPLSLTKKQKTKIWNKFLRGL